MKHPAAMRWGRKDTPPQLEYRPYGLALNRSPSQGGEPKKTDIMRDHYYVTTPIYYVNDRPHIGHAYTSVACDALARYMRLDGRRVKFLTGTDEHGQKIEKTAKAQHITPQELVDSVSVSFREMTGLLNLSNDDFIRTTEERHKRSVQAVWKRLEASGDIYLGKYAGWYAVRDEAFYAESELIDGKAPSGAEVEWVEEPSYFFRLSAWRERLLKFYEENPGFVMPASRFNEVKRFVEGGLQDLSVSRTSFSWGVPVPGDEAHVMYVWFDALVNYLTATGYPDANEGEFWPADLHMVGKDILRFHAVYWPAFLLSAGIAPPKRVFAHGWWTIEGEKMSKSLGNAIAPGELVEQYGVDQTRYFLLREVPFGNDGNFAREAMVRRINSELANNIGNLAQRTLSMIAKHCEGSVPVYHEPAFTPEDRALLERVLVTSEKTAAEMREAMESCRFQEALSGIVEAASKANEYIDAMAPWKLKKENPERMESVLYVLAESLRGIAIMLQPFIPDSAGRLLDLLAVPQDKRMFAHLHADGPEKPADIPHALKPGTPLPAPVGIFPRIAEEKAA